jgi:hypothetical protein
MKQDPPGEHLDRQEAQSATNAAGGEPHSRLDLGGTFSAWMALLGIHIFVLTYVIPSFDEMFKDIGKGLPTQTIFILNASRLARSPTGIATSALVILASIGMLWLPWPRSRKILIFKLLAFAGFLLIPFIVVALFLPLVGEIKNVGGR